MDLRTVLADHGIEDASKATIDGDFNLLKQQLTDLDQYMNNAFYDGVIEETEARKIEIYLNLLRESDRKVQERYDQISTNGGLEEGEVKSELFAAKANYDLLLSALFSTINYVIADNIATPSEGTSVDEAYLDFMEASGRLEKAFEVAVDAIIGKRTKVAEQNAIARAEEIKTEVGLVTDDLDRRLLAAEGYVDGSFRDGIITEFEAKNILSYLDSLNLRKTELDKRYIEIYNNYFLSGVPKTNLQNSKNNYDAKHQATIDLINQAISDDKATPEESDSVRQSFVELNTALDSLVSAFEKAIDSLSQARADKAEELAKESANEYTDREVGTLDNILKQIAADNTITPSERGSIKDDVTKITGIILADDEPMPLLPIIDSNQKGEVYSARNEAIQAGLQSTHLDYNGLEEAYTGLANYLNALDPKPWDVTSTENITVDKVVWRTKWLDYYLAVSVLRERIAEYLKNATDTVGGRVTETEESIRVLNGEIALTVKQKIYEDQMKTVNERIDTVADNVTTKVEIFSSNGLAFKNGMVNTVLEARVFEGKYDITDTVNAANFRWTRVSQDAEGDAAWNTSNAGGTKTITVTPADVKVRATFNCEVSTDE